MARDVWGKHPAELGSGGWERWMLDEMIALSVIEGEDRLETIDRRRNGYDG